MRRCGLCGQLMLTHKKPWPKFYMWTPLKGRLDCAGDCLRCMKEIEGR